MGTLSAHYPHWASLFLFCMIGVFPDAKAGMTSDEVRKFEAYKVKAEAGDSIAQYNLGVCHAKGEGVAKDDSKAVWWYRKSAEQGYGPAQSNLGVCYATGEGVLKDEIEAYAYWNLAGITLEEARKNLAILEKNLSRDEIAAGQRRSKELQKEIEAKMASKKPSK